MPIISEMEVEPTAIAGLWTVQAKQVRDERGVVREFYRHSVFAEAGIAVVLDQINITETRLGAIRGIHGEDMDKLVGVAHGRVHAKIVCREQVMVLDFELEPGKGLFVSAGLGNSFQSLTDASQYVYGFSMEWQPGMSGFGINPLDPAVGRWPLGAAKDNLAYVSAKDAALPTLAEAIGR